MRILKRCAPARTASRQRGATTVELVIMLPVLALVGLSALQFALVMEQKNALTYALEEAVRSGSTGHATSDAIEAGLARGLMPVLVGAKSQSEIPAALAQTQVLITSAESQQFLQWQQISPNQQAFDDFGITVNGVRQIPNDNLTIRPTQVGASSGQTLIDANLLKVKMTYGVSLSVPLVGEMMSTLLNIFETDPVKQQMLKSNRMPVELVYAARMQSAAYQNGATISHSQQASNGSSLGSGVLDPLSQFFNNLPSSYANIGTSDSSSTGNEVQGIDWGEDGNLGAVDLTGGTGGNNGGDEGSGGTCSVPQGSSTAGG